MADAIELLKQLQAMDGELYRLRKQRKDKPLELEQIESEVAVQDTRVKAAGERLKTLQVQQKEKELELATREANVKKLQGQLFQLKTNKEYSTMQREIEAQKADNSLLEEEILRTLEAIDRATKDRQAEQATLTQEQARLGKERTRIEQEIAALEERLAQVERQRQGLIPDVPKKELAAYERVLNIRDGLALVPIVNESCGGCDRRVTSQVINEVYLKTKLVACEHCSRILYFDEAHSKL